MWKTWPSSSLGLQNLTKHGALFKKIQKKAASSGQSCHQMLILISLAIFQSIVSILTIWKNLLNFTHIYSLQILNPLLVSNFIAMKYNIYLLNPAIVLPTTQDRSCPSSSLILCLDVGGWWKTSIFPAFVLGVTMTVFSIGVTSLWCCSSILALILTALLLASLMEMSEPVREHFPEELQSPVYVGRLGCALNWWEKRIE